MNSLGWHSPGELHLRPNYIQKAPIDIGSHESFTPKLFHYLRSHGRTNPPLLLFGSGCQNMNMATKPSECFQSRRNKWHTQGRPKAGVWRVRPGSWDGAFALLLQEEAGERASRKLWEDIKSPLPDSIWNTGKETFKGGQTAAVWYLRVPVMHSTCNSKYLPHGMWWQLEILTLRTFSQTKLKCTHLETPKDDQSCLLSKKSMRK